MENITKQLQAYGSILTDLTKALDLATPQQLEVLARIFRAYVHFEGPEEHEMPDDYLEDVLLTIIGTDGFPEELMPGKLLAAKWALDYARIFDDSAEDREDHGLLRTALLLAEHGGDEKQPLRMREAFQRAIKEQDEKKAKEQRTLAVVEKPAAKVRRKARKAA